MHKNKIVFHIKRAVQYSTLNHKYDRLTGWGVSYKQWDEVGDGRLPFGEAVKVTGGVFLGFLSWWQLVQGQMVLLFKELTCTRGEPWTKCRQMVYCPTILNSFHLVFVGHLENSFKVFLVKGKIFHISDLENLACYVIHLTEKVNYKMIDYLKIPSNNPTKNLVFLIYLGMFF